MSPLPPLDQPLVSDVRSDFDRETAERAKGLPRDRRASFLKARAALFAAEYSAELLRDRGAEDRLIRAADAKWRRMRTCVERIAEGRLP